MGSTVFTSNNIKGQKTVLPYKIEPS